MTSIAFIGLGNMGGGMAANLAKAGHDVRTFERCPVRAGTMFCNAKPNLSR